MAANISPRRIRFSPVSSQEGGSSPGASSTGSPRRKKTGEDGLKKPKHWTHYFKQFKVSRMIGIALVILFTSNVLFMVAFVTNGWGVLEVHKAGHFTRGTNATHAYWNFGLWQCCRDDGFCLGTRWPVFYSATRALCVMVLFGHILSFAWMVGHSLEKLLDYDKCTMSTLISLCYASAFLLSLAVITFGVRWPTEFRHEFSGTDAYLSYSFYLALLCVPLTFAAGGFATADLALKIREFDRSAFVGAEHFDLEDVERKMEKNVFLQKQDGQMSDITDV